MSDSRYERFLARLSPEQRQQWDAACKMFAEKFGPELASRPGWPHAEADDEPCCRPENCPNSPQWNGERVVGWGGFPDHAHRCCICAV